MKSNRKGGAARRERRAFSAEFKAEAVQLMVARRAEGATLTKELLADGLLESRASANRELFTFIEIWYNRQRRHSSLGYRSPVQFEAEMSKVS